MYDPPINVPQRVAPRLLLHMRPHVLHHTVLGLSLRLLLVEAELFGAAGVTEFSAAFGPREEPIDGRFGCKRKNILE